MLIKKEFKLIFPFFLILVGLGSFFLPYFSTNTLQVQNVDVGLKFNGDHAKIYLVDQVNIGNRIPGTQEREDCANYFISKFKEIDSNFTYLIHDFTTHSTDCQNILFKLNEDNSRIIILGAHYDSRAKATRDSDPLKINDPVDGANDGASGSAVLIELAKAFYEVRENLSSQIWFLFFDAEDQGKDKAYGIDGWGWCEGSTAFVNEIYKFYDNQTEAFDAMILLDMVGGKNLRFIKEDFSTSSLVDELFATGRELGYTSQFPSNPTTSDGITDDHVAFVNIGIPSADLIINFWDKTVYPYHHTTQDIIINTENSSLEATGRTVEQFIYNNYFNTTTKTYKGNYPWFVDIDMAFVETTMYIIIIAAIGVILVLTWKIVKQKPDMIEPKR